MHDPPAPGGVTIWHNPACGTSRSALALLRASGVEPSIRLYLDDPPSRAEIEAALAATGLAPWELLRTHNTPAADMGLTDPTMADDALLEAMEAHPILINRPLVWGPRGVVLARPPERALDVLEPKRDRTEPAG